MPPRYRFLDPEVIAKIPSMELRARLVVEGYLTGIHRSPFHGYSVEFAEHRPYMPGDDIRHIDWKVWAKSDRYYLKRFEEETNLKCYLLLDTSASMGYRSKGLSKLEYGSYLAASLAYLMLYQRDAVGLVTFDEEIRTFLPPRSSPGHVYQVLHRLESIVPGRKTVISKALHRLAEQIKRRGLVILISDLLDDPEKVLGGLKHFRHRRHEVIVFHLVDPREVDFPFDYPTLFKDMETGESLRTLPWTMREVYQKQFNAFIQTYRRGCFESNIDYSFLSTGKPLEGALSEYLSHRASAR